MKDSQEIHNDQDLPVFVKWVDFLKWLLHATDKFPKKVRFTFSDRINNLALDVVTSLVDARYSKHKYSNLIQINHALEKLRVLLRISFEQRYFSHKAYEHAMYSINEVGKMVGGWMKQQDALGKK